MTTVEHQERDPNSVRREIRSRMRNQRIWVTGEAKPGRQSHLDVPFLTVDETPTLLAVTPDTRTMLAPKPISIDDFRDVAKTLAQSQQHYIPIGSEEEHQKTILFLRENWRRIRRYLYPFPAPGTFPAAHFSEVDLRDDKKQRADFVGFGSDGRLFVIEVGTRSKSGQVDGYIDSLRRLIHDKASVTPFVAYYSAHAEGKTIEIKPPYIPKVEFSNKAIEFIKDLGQSTLPIPQKPHLARFLK